MLDLTFQHNWWREKLKVKRRKKNTKLQMECPFDVICNSNHPELANNIESIRTRTNAARVTSVKIPSLRLKRDVSIKRRCSDVGISSHFAPARLSDTSPRFSHTSQPIHPTRRRRGNAAFAIEAAVESI
jgi:hypothetical protein